MQNSFSVHAPFRTNISLQVCTAMHTCPRVDQTEYQPVSSALKQLELLSSPLAQSTNCSQQRSGRGRQRVNASLSHGPLTSRARVETETSYVAQFSDGTSATGRSRLISCWSLSSGIGAVTCMPMLRLIEDLAQSPVKWPLHAAAAHADPGHRATDRPSGAQGQAAAKQRGVHTCAQGEVPCLHIASSRTARAPF